MLQECKFGRRDTNLHVFLPKNYFNYASYIFLREMMDVSHFYIMIKSKVGVDFDVSTVFLKGEHQNPFPPCSSLLRPSRKQNRNIDLPCTPIRLMKYFLDLVQNLLGYRLWAPQLYSINLN